MTKRTEYKIELAALHITGVCSHKCPTCYIANDLIKPKHPLLLDLLKIVDELAKNEIKEIVLLGGDPACYPNVIELAKYIHEKGIKISILSNTLNFPNTTIEEASKYIDAFETTIHHYIPEKHDEFCSKEGAYNNVVNQLRKASMLNKKTGIAINVIPEISDKIYELVNRIVKIEKVNLDYIIVQRIVPFGRASKSSDFTLSRKHAEQALAGIKKVDKVLNIQISVEDPFPLCVLPENVKKYMTPCAWGYTKVAVNAQGDLSRCGADPRYRLGNIFVDNLKDIWNNSEILKSFRSREYLPGRCRICESIENCGGGCPLSCEIEKDHGIDYLFLEYEKLDEEIHGNITFTKAKEFELSSILQIEWSDFPRYGHVFSVSSLKKWFKYNPNMFWVVKDSRNWVLGYATLVPITKSLHNDICNGKYSSLVEFPDNQVLKSSFSDYYHIEVIAMVPSRTASRAGRFLINNVSHLLINRKYITASPVTDIGIRLCNFFEFEFVTNEVSDTTPYPIYKLVVNKKNLIDKISRF